MGFAHPRADAGGAQLLTAFGMMQFSGEVLGWADNSAACGLHELPIVFCSLSGANRGHFTHITHTAAAD